MDKTPYPQLEIIDRLERIEARLAAIEAQRREVVPVPPTLSGPDWWSDHDGFPMYGPAMIPMPWCDYGAYSGIIPDAALRPVTT